MTDDLNKDVQELSDEELTAVSGGKLLLCPRGTFKMCATRDGKYSCWCEPLAIPQTTEQ